MNMITRITGSRVKVQLHGHLGLKTASDLFYSKLQKSCHRLGKDGWWPMSSCGCETIGSLLIFGHNYF